MGFAYPTIGQWFRRPDGALLEVVATDEDDHTIEIQFFDGTIDEVEVRSWRDLLLVEIDIDRTAWLNGVTGAIATQFGIVAGVACGGHFELGSATAVAE